MTRRVVWFASGAVAGVAGTKFVKRKAVSVAKRLKPSNVVTSAGQAVQRSGQRVADAVREGTSSARRKENELLARREGRLVHLDEHLDEGDELFVDGEAVESGRVLVMRRRSQTGR